MKSFILGIESSCDDSSIAVMDINTFELKFYEKISQESEHSIYGGVVPELAARLHTKALPDILFKVRNYFDDLVAVSVTNEPGLSVSLLGGVAMAKAVSLSLNIPLIGINHLIGHIYSLFIDTNAEFPLGVLLVSGGHTLILDIDKEANIVKLASTSDDSFGESFDKVAKMLGLGYPGGVQIENLSKMATKHASFTVPLKHDKRLEYSFSGLKNQVRVMIENCKSLGTLDDEKANIAAGFQDSACEHIMDKLSKIFSERKWRKFGVVGGASANLLLRSKLEKICSEYDCELLLTPLKFCSDNAVMIARAGVSRYKQGKFDDIHSLQINPKSTRFMI